MVPAVAPRFKPLSATSYEFRGTFDQELTGGVHNMFATNDHLYAISGGDKYVIVDMADITAPKYVAEYNHPDSRVPSGFARRPSLPSTV